MRALKNTVLHRVALPISRRVQFRGKRRILKWMGATLSNKSLVPQNIEEVRCLNSIRMSTDTNADVMFRELYIHGLYQDDVLVALRGLLKAGDVFWDVGANYGFMSVYVSRVFNGTVKTLAFEPSPSVIRVLRHNLERNQCQEVEIVEQCLSNEVGEVSFYTSADHSWNATMIPEFAETHNENIEIKVPATTIDALVSTGEQPAPSVIKLDVEGAEHLVLEGGRDFLSQTPVPLIAEFNRQAIADAGLTSQAYLDIFQGLGYRIHLMKRPWLGLHKWNSLYEVKRERDLPDLCNVIALA